VLTGTASSKVTAAHLARTALLYVRQSSLKQVLHNTESAIRQYDLRGRAIALGWAVGQITVIDTQRPVPLPAAAPVGVHPVPQGPLVDPQVPGHLRDRLARLPDQPHRALLEVRIELPA
jgi:hypothetical protein